jgi:GDSL-like lipase/acylhydrolase family protein
MVPPHALDVNRSRRILTLDRSSVPAPCRDVQVLNAGVNGYNTEQEVAFIRRTGLRYQPDVVIVGFTPNDIMMASETKTMLRFPALRKVLEQSALCKFVAPRIKALILPSQRRAYDETLSKFLGRPDSAVLARWAHVRAALLQLDELAEWDSFHLLVATFPFVSQLDRASRSAAPQELLRQLNSESGIPVLDLLPAFQQAAARGEQPFLTIRRDTPAPEATPLLPRNSIGSWPVTSSCPPASSLRFGRKFLN